MTYLLVFAASASLADPPGSSVLLAAVSWLQGTVLGTMATTVALVAVAAVGMMMLTGRIHIRRGATVILGCFILFGAPGIAVGIQNATRGSDRMMTQSRPVESSPLANLSAPAAPSSGYDPYAGASLPHR
ncbi:TrbC/VirB2 family protein [Sphingomonas sp. JC676]|uniref:TrbC/VirB2 family protein n=1 Tax=Sphingomonas sp. JC676 TaxID=2768065 RepID=UPI0016581003|nr:TrbC/VirB2 family protein [Sphingomonas sp. JC676]MBC9032996.1 TrbC/VirB2 family protein [Sphingomonas sp. JC676]